MSGGGSSSTTKPWSGSTDYLSNILSEAQGLYNQDTEYVGLTPEQKSLIGQMSELYQSGMGGTTGQAQNAWTQLLRSPEEVAQSQQVQDMISANTSQVTDQLLQSALPAVRSGAATAGQYGSSRQAIAESLATNEAAKTAQNYATNLTGNIYQQQLQNQMNALDYTGSLQAILGGNLEGQFNLQDILRQDEQNANNWGWEQLQQLANLVYPAAGMGGTTTTSGSGTSALQGAAGGAAIGTSIYPGWGTAIGAVLGGLSA